MTTWKEAEEKVKAIARMFRETDPRHKKAYSDIAAWALWEELRDCLCDLMTEDNPRFDRERFIQATEDNDDGGCHDCALCPEPCEKETAP